MYWIYILILLAVSGIVSEILYRGMKFKRGHTVSFVSLILCAVIGFISLGVWIYYTVQVARINSMPVYIETYGCEPSPYAGFRLNNWLNEAKMDKMTYGEWCIYPQSIFDVIPCK